jgi:hypothetical protein
MRIRFTLLLIVLCLTLNASCVGSMPAQDVDVSEQWSYDSIRFEIAPLTTSTVPDPVALEWFRERLHDYRFCDKAQITFVIQPEDTARPLPPLPVPVWDIVSLLGYTARRRTMPDYDVEDRDLVVFVPYIDGLYAQLDGIKWLGGLQYQPSAFAVFKHGAGDHEPAVLLHEFGHLIGLADEGNHGKIDPKHTSHCADRNCVMYFSTPTSRAVFDGYCLAFIRSRRMLRNARRY